MEFSWPVIILIAYIVISVVRASSSNSGPAPQHGKVINVESQQAFKELTASGPVVVDFFATWCGPCKAIAPKVGELSETYTNVRFLQVDVDKQQQIARDLGVTAMPTFVLFKNGKELDRIRGANARALENGIEQIA
ncbi:thioredoxin, putative [Talaromyces stipitatus ATCC 10500]|uniref:Thioredoxin, putative n=1 Tax=Talaromyces stipitatus (strain ATCC 10500 / CBS 375.48 / QM 6759 / NRRL 1006) TaxID=441959 RepID=B8LYT8_TALSN|nr:thioredoxin, putative [Talaromyces stipitatus ATCC 10500]EED23446.1 thioredoxin, putative [Talaromyces stipitatus ATCC 10500]